MEPSWPHEAPNVLLHVRRRCSCRICRWRRPDCPRLGRLLGVRDGWTVEIQMLCSHRCRSSQLMRWLWHSAHFYGLTVVYVWQRVLWRGARHSPWRASWHHFIMQRCASAADGHLLARTLPPRSLIGFPHYTVLRPTSQRKRRPAKQDWDSVDRWYRYFLFATKRQPNQAKTRV